MSTSAFFFDLSGAIPWFLAGLLTALLLMWLRRILDPRRSTGQIPARPVEQQALISDTEQVQALEQRHAEQLARLDEDLAEAKTSAVRFANEKSALEAELRAARGGTSAQISQLNQLQADLETARRAEIASRNQISDLNAVLAPLRRDIEAHAARAQAKETEAANLTRQIALRDAEIDRLSKLDGLPASGANDFGAERSRLNSEIAGLKSQLAAQATELANKTSMIALRDADLQKREQANGAGLTEVTAERNRLFTENASLRSQMEAKSAELSNTNRFMAMRDAELDRLEKLVGVNTASPVSPVPASVVAERDQLKSDMEAARRAYEALKAEHQKAETALFNVGPEIEQLRQFRASHAAEIARLTTQVTSLTADLENFRRFKDALDTANRIAGQRTS